MPEYQRQCLEGEQIILRKHDDIAVEQWRRCRSVHKSEAWLHFGWGFRVCRKNDAPRLVDDRRQRRFERLRRRLECRLCSLRNSQKQGRKSDRTPKDHLGAIVMLVVLPLMTVAVASG